MYISEGIMRKYVGCIKINFKEKQKYVVLNMWGVVNYMWNFNKTIIYKFAGNIYLTRTLTLN